MTRRVRTQAIAAASAVLGIVTALQVIPNASAAGGVITGTLRVVEASTGVSSAVLQASDGTVRDLDLRVADPERDLESFNNRTVSIAAPSIAADGDVTATVQQLSVTSAAPPPAPRAKKLLAIKVSFSSYQPLANGAPPNPQPLTDDDILRHLVSAPNAALKYWRESSNELFSFGGVRNPAAIDIVPEWIQITADAAKGVTGAAGCNLSDFAASADAKALIAGYRVADYTNVLYFLGGVSTTVCHAFGYGGLEGATTWFPTLLHDGSPLYTASSRFRMYGNVAHELGHNFGLGHAGAFCSTCPGGYEPYGDPFDVMGDSQRMAQVSIGQKRTLGILTDANVVTAYGTQTVDLAPMEQAVGGAQMLVVPTVTGDKLTLEWRQPLGFFDSSSDVALTTAYSGPLMRVERANARGTILIDATPSAVDNPLDAALPMGKTWSDPSLGVSVTNLGIFSGKLRIQTTTQVAPPVTAPPVIAVLNGADNSARVTAGAGVQVIVGQRLPRTCSLPSATSPALTTLCDVQVRIGRPGVAGYDALMPLVSTSIYQVNGYFPYNSYPAGVPKAGAKTVAVAVNGVVGPAFTINVSDVRPRPGIPTYMIGNEYLPSGTFLNATRNWTRVTQSSPAQPGDWLVVYGTGFGPVTSVADGQFSPATPVPVASSAQQVFLNGAYLGDVTPARIPNALGGEQLRFQIPLNGNFPVGPGQSYNFRTCLALPDGGTCSAQNQNWTDDPQSKPVSNTVPLWIKNTGVNPAAVPPPPLLAAPSTISAGSTMPNALPLDTTPPAATFTEPLLAAVARSTATPLAVNATDNDAVVRVEFYVPGVMAGSSVLLSTDYSAPFQASWNTMGTASGSYRVITAKAYDGSGNVITINKGVTVR